MSGSCLNAEVNTVPLFSLYTIPLYCTYILVYFRYSCLARYLSLYTFSILLTRHIVHHPRVVVFESTFSLLLTRHIVHHPRVVVFKSMYYSQFIIQMHLYFFNFVFMYFLYYRLITSVNIFVHTCYIYIYIFLSIRFFDYFLYFFFLSVFQ